MKLWPIASLFSMILSSASYAHCIVPEKAEWHFVCHDSEGQVKVIAKVFNDADPRNCPSTVDFDYQGEHPVNSVTEHYVAGKAVIRQMGPDNLELLMAFGSQNHFAAYISKSKTKGYIEFAGGPSWDLDCSQKN